MAKLARFRSLLTILLSMYYCLLPVWMTAGVTRCEPLSVRCRLDLKPSQPITQKTIDHQRKAAAHYQHAARHNSEAANHHASDRHEEARHHALLALGHHLHATYHAEEAAKYPQSSG